MTGRVPHPSLPGALAAPDEVVHDQPVRWTVTDSTEPYRTDFIGVREETVATPDGGRVLRTIVRHHGAVAVVALDDDDRILLLEQYRHPVGHRLLEIPAGILDVEGESPLDAARRELGEETDLRAQSWEELVTVYSSPGFTDEQIQIFLADGLEPVADDDRTTRTDEEADMTSVWLPLSEAVAAVLDGRMHNSLAVTGILAVHARRTRSGRAASGPDTP